MRKILLASLILFTSCNSNSKNSNSVDPDFETREHKLVTSYHAHDTWSDSDEFSFELQAAFKDAPMAFRGTIQDIFRTDSGYTALITG